MLELVEYSADDLLNYLLANSGKTKEQLIEEYCCVREKEHSKKHLQIFSIKSHMQLIMILVVNV